MILAMCIGHDAGIPADNAYEEAYYTFASSVADNGASLNALVVTHNENTFQVRKV